MTANAAVGGAARAAVESAARALRAGDLVVFPTETVYGVGADATNDRAVAALYALKGRPRFNPLIAHVSGVEMAARLVEISPLAQRLMAAFWPGPLTLVLPRRGDCPVSRLASDGLETLAIRQPDHPLAQALLVAFGGPLVAPSANRSGRVSPTTAAHVQAEFGSETPTILDGGPCRVGLESTVLDLSGLTGSGPRLLRPGGLTREALEAHLGPLDEAWAMRATDDRPLAPGQLESHYAPARALRLNAHSSRPFEALLAFGDAETSGFERVFWLSRTGDLVEAAARLFEGLRTLDGPGPGAIAVSPIPELGLGVAINDRLRRAAAPRPSPGAPVVVS